MSPILSCTPSYSNLDPELVMVAAAKLSQTPPEPRKLAWILGTTDLQKWGGEGGLQKKGKLFNMDSNAMSGYICEFFF